MNARLPLHAAARRLGLTVEQTVREVYFGTLVARRGSNEGLRSTLYFKPSDLKAWKRSRR